MNPAIKVQNVSKTFKLPHEKQNSIKSIFINLFSSKKTYESQQVLTDISFEVKEGEFFGIVGRNGSGKSTLLKMLAGIYEPNKGTIQVQGKLTPFIELGVGFNPNLTGRENVFLNGALLGFNRKEMYAMYDEIVNFAELHKFMDQKLKNYSSGMQVRLAFAIAINAKSDILLLDEVLAVGDASFQKKCFAYFRQLKRNKKTVIFISHDMNAVREYCTKAILIDKGKIIHQGSAEVVAQEYTRMFSQQKESNIVGKQDTSKRYGTNAVTAQSIEVYVKDKVIDVNIVYIANKKVNRPIFGLTINSPSGLRIFESNTKWRRIKTDSYAQSDIIKIKWMIPNIFTNGCNYITIAVADSTGTEFYDWWAEATSFIIDKDLITTAVTLPEFEVEINVS